MNKRKAAKFAKVDAQLITWMAVHGNLLLALRHPQNSGPSAEVVRGFCDALGKMLVKDGLLTQAELDHVYEVERRERARRMQ